MCDNELLHRKPGIVVVDKLEKTCIVNDTECISEAVVIDNNGEQQKTNSLNGEVYKLWLKKWVEGAHIVVVALVHIGTNFRIGSGRSRLISN